MNARQHKKRLRFIIGTHLFGGCIEDKQMRRIVYRKRGCNYKKKHLHFFRKDYQMSRGRVKDYGK